MPAGKAKANFALGSVRISLSSPDQRIQRSYESLLQLAIVPPEQSKEEISVALTLVDYVPNRPAGKPLFGHPPAQSGSERQASLLEVYQAGPDFILYFQDAAAVRVSDDEIRGVVTSAVWRDGRFSDVIYTSLAPPLRRKGVYLVHAAAVGRNGAGMLIVGPSGSGKSTTTLALVLAGWQYLANDVVAVQRTGKGIVAWPTPDVIGVTSNTMQLLPALDATVETGHTFAGKRPLDGAVVVDRLGGPVQIRQIVFPQVTAATLAQLERLDAAMALARLVESSVDRWDRSCVGEHIDLLTVLCRQAGAAELRLGNSIDSVVEALSNAL